MLVAAVGRRAAGRPTQLAGLLSARSARRGGSSLGWGDSAVAAGVAPGRWDASRLLQEARQLVAPGQRDFAVHAAESSIPGAGLGVYVDAASRGVAVPAGSVVALYPGVYFPLVPLGARASARGEPVQDVLWLARELGYGVIDDGLTDVSFDEASSYWLILEMHSGIMDGFQPAVRVGSEAARSSYAVGNLVNHPSKGTKPNVAWQEFRWEDADESAGLAANRLHKGLWYLDPSSLEPVGMPDREAGGPRLPVPGVAIVALRDLLHGEELFMDYRLSKPHPPWYTPVPHSPE